MQEAASPEIEASAAADGQRPPRSLLVRRWTSGIVLLGLCALFAFAVVTSGIPKWFVTTCAVLLLTAAFASGISEILPERLRLALGWSGTKDKEER